MKRFNEIITLALILLVVIKTIDFKNLGLLDIILIVLAAIYAALCIILFIIQRKEAKK